MNAAAVVPMAAAVGSECAKTMADQSSKRRRKSRKRHERDDGNHMKLPKGKFGAIMADPAIPFTTWSRKGQGRTPQHHYRCEAFDKLAAVPVASVAKPDCFLFLWVPSRSVFLVKPLMAAWGFVFTGKAFTWAKQNPSGVGWHMGTGYTTRKNTEDCWLGRRGKPIKPTTEQ
jgi:N6-adenosine-specific RNA methylase IME4